MPVIGFLNSASAESFAPFVVAFRAVGNATGSGCGRSSPRVDGTSCRALEMMQRNFGKTVNADGNDRCPDTDRGITHHIAMFPRSRAHMPWQNRIKSDRDRPRQTDLTSVGMTAHKQIETAMCGL